MESQCNTGQVEQQDSKTYVHYKNEYEGYLVEDSYIICTVKRRNYGSGPVWLKPKVRAGKGYNFRFCRPP